MTVLFDACTVRVPSPVPCKNLLQLCLVPEHEFDGVILRQNLLPGSLWLLLQDLRGRWRKSRLDAWKRL